MEAEKHGTLHVLWIDDNLRAQINIARILREKFGVALSFASTLRAAEAQLARSDFDVVISDFLLSGPQETAAPILEYIDRLYVDRPNKPYVIFFTQGPYMAAELLEEYEDKSRFSIIDRMNTWELIETIEHRATAKLEEAN